MNGFIYLITSLSNRIYIGQTNNIYMRKAKMWETMDPNKKKELLDKRSKTKISKRINNCKCEECNIEFHRKPSLLDKHIYCSAKCFNENTKRTNRERKASI